MSLGNCYPLRIWKRTTKTLSLALKRPTEGLFSFDQAEEYEGGIKKFQSPAFKRGLNKREESAISLIFRQWLISGGLFDIISLEEQRKTSHVKTKQSGSYLSCYCESKRY